MFDPLEHPALAHVWLAQRMAHAAGQPIIVSAGMGLDEMFLTMNDEESLRQMRAIEYARAAAYKVWRGFDVRHIAAHGGVEFCQFDVFSALDVAIKHLSQEALDFITLRDIGSARLESSLRIDMPNTVRESAERWYGIDEEVLHLAIAVRKQMVAEAQPYRQRVKVGAYVMLREPLKKLDARLVYDTLRLVITPAGIACAVVRENEYVPFWWSPDRDTNTSQVWVTGDVCFLLDILLSTIWRDACVLEEVFAERRDKGRGYQSAGKPQHKNTLVRLPQRIYKSQWGSTAERENVEAVLRRAHHVRAHYARLAEGRKRSEQADGLAREYYFDPIPEGYTFVRPHERGTGDVMPDVRPVMCRGLQRVRLLLNR